MRTGDKGRDRDGKPLGNFEPGSDVMRQGDGARARARSATSRWPPRTTSTSHGEDPQRWELGVKEVWEVPKPLDRVIHTMGWPLRKGARGNEFGGSFIYPMGEDKVCIGMRRRPRLHRRDLLRATTCCSSSRPIRSCAKMLEGGKRVAWGAKTIPVRRLLRDAASTLAVPGMCIAGDAAGMVNIPTLKGIHYAMHAGMYAAEAIVDALKQDSINFEAYDKTRARVGDRRGASTSHATCASRSRRASSWVARWPAR